MNFETYRMAFARIAETPVADDLQLIPLVAANHGLLPSCRVAAAST